MAGSGAGPLLKFGILVAIALLAFSVRLFAVIRFESIIHEFDPWFNYRATRNLVEDGFYNFLNWFDTRAWYPLGRIVGGTVYPGLMVTSGALHTILHALHIPVHIKDICVFLAPVFSALTAFAMYLFTTEVWNDSAGLLAAAFIGIVPGYISRSVAGSYDNEGIAIFALMFTYFLWVRSTRTGSIFWASLCAVSYFYMVGAWGGYVFIINLIPLHVLALLLMGRCEVKIYTAYTTFFILGLIMSMQVPFVGFLPLKTSEHMAAIGVFGLLQLHMLFNTVRSRLTADEFRKFYMTLLGAALVFCVPALMTLTYLGYVAPFSGRFYSLWDTGYAKIHIPIIASVSEHQPTTWTSFFMDLHILASFFPAGLWFCLHRLTNERVFVVLYAVSAVYFAGVMVRLMLTLTPIVVVCAAISISHILSSFFGHTDFAPHDKPKAKRNKKEEKKEEKEKEKAEDAAPADTPSSPSKSSSSSSSSAAAAAKSSEKLQTLETRAIVIVMLAVMMAVFAIHCTWVTSHAYSSPSVVLATNNPDGSRNILDDFREAYYWLRFNTPEDARVMSWWDYGYQIAGFANRTTLVDNNTWNNSHIAMVGMAMSSNETRAYEIMRSLDVNYVLVIFGAVIGYSGDDINKFLWMVRIAEGEHPDEIHEPDYFTPSGEYRMDNAASQRMRTCLMYKLSYYRFSEMRGGYDRTRNSEIGEKNIKLTFLEEAFTSENWLVRIYRVKDPHNRKKELLSVSEQAIEIKKQSWDEKSMRKGRIAKKK